jgi:hypothetical protein
MQRLLVVTVLSFADRAAWVYCNCGFRFFCSCLTCISEFLWFTMNFMVEQARLRRLLLQKRQTKIVALFAWSSSCLY